MKNSQDTYEDVLRIKSKTIHLNLTVVVGREGDYHVCIAPSALISGYGKTKEEAKKSFEINIDVFCQDIMAMSTRERNAYLSELGFKQQPLKTKNYSKTFVDEDGLIQGLEDAEISREELEAA